MQLQDKIKQRIGVGYYQLVLRILIEFASIIRNYASLKKLNFFMELRTMHWLFLFRYANILPRADYKEERIYCILYT